jgi:hypothetical protein
LVNPYPRYSSDIILSKSRVSRFIDKNLKLSPEEFEIGPKVIYSQGEMKFGTDKVISDAYLTALLYPYNSLGSTE